ncbi:MAG: DUF1178 family protein [Roseicyclus sp.]|jgi:hypothetical protein|nr:DUF1178 family protein [Roseicyclus sp.]
MIRYTLKCAEGHGFDSWFQSADAYEALAARGMVSCAICGGTDVTKALMAPRVSVAESAPAEPPAAPAVPDRPLSAPAHPAEQMLRALREHLQKSSTYVGGRFAQEARAMHLGEVDERPIHGEASPAEARALIEEGVPIAPLPILPPDKTN